MYTNEELAVHAKAGDKEAIFLLWEQDCKLIFKLMSRYFPLCSKYGLEPEDLTQSGYFALVRAVEAYKPESETLFTSYLHYHVQTVVHEAFNGRRRGSHITHSYVKRKRL